MGEDRSRPGAGRVERDEAVLACFGAVDAPLSAAVVSVMAGVAEAEVAVVLTRAEQSGMLDQAAPGWYVLDLDRHIETSDAHLAQWRARLLDFLTHATGDDWLRDPGLGAGRRLIENILAWNAPTPRAVALCDLITRLWNVTVEHPGVREDSGWRRCLAIAGEQAARASENAVRVGAMLEHAGRACAAVGDLLLAESQLVRAVEVWQQVHDEGRVDATLSELVRVFSVSGQWARALDAAFVLLDVQRGRGQGRAAARTLALIGGLMRQAGRSESALEYWQQAESAFAAIDVDPREPAGVLLVAGRHQWVLDRHRPAQDAWHRALALLVDVDDDAAEQVRAHLRLRPGDPLPPSDPG